MYLYDHQQRGRSYAVRDPEDHQAYQQPENDHGFGDIKDTQAGGANGDDFVIMIKLAEGVEGAQKAGKGSDLDEHQRKVGQVKLGQKRIMHVEFQDILKPREHVDNHVHKKEDEDAGDKNRDYGFQDIPV